MKNKREIILFNKFIEHYFTENEAWEAVEKCIENNWDFEDYVNAKEGKVSILWKI